MGAFGLFGHLTFYPENGHFWAKDGLKSAFKGTLSLRIKNAYMKPFDPLNTGISSKNSVELFNPPKKPLKFISPC